MEKISLVVLDLDDTLISTSQIYNECVEEMASYLASIGFDYQEAYALNREIDRGRVKKLGVMKERFPKSMVLTYSALCKKHKVPFVPSHAIELTKIGYSVFTKISELLPSVISTLKVLHKKYTVCILTRGDKGVQLQRVLDAGVLDYVEQVFVVDDKVPSTFTNVCNFFSTPTTNSIMVGDSLKVDILPALEANLFALYLQNGTYDIGGCAQSSPPVSDRLFISKSISALPSILEKHNG